MLQSVPSYRLMWCPLRIMLAVLLIASGPSVQVGKVLAVNFSMFGYLSAISLPVIYLKPILKLIILEKSVLLVLCLSMFEHMLNLVCLLLEKAFGYLFFFQICFFACMHVHVLLFPFLKPL